ncbi:MAG: hypothetical protein JWO97_1560 [Acidobacteria bacterium]|nr:hypothetical protein [Acidobacteriota bacterium]
MKMLGIVGGTGPESTIEYSMKCGASRGFRCSASSKRLAMSRSNSNGSYTTAT